MNIYIPGFYTTKIGELWDRDLRSLAIEAATGALNSANLDITEIDAIYVANMCGSRFTGQDHLGALIASELGSDAPSFHLEAACASGSIALRSAYLDLLSGSSKNILIVGVEKMTDVSVDNATTGLSGASDEEWEAYYGVTFPSLYAMIAREHMFKFGTTREQMALCAVKNHKNAVLNEIAHFRKEVTINEVINSTMVAEPLGLLDCSPISDGASAIILSSINKSGVKMIASGHAQDSLALHDREDITTLKATVKASQKAFKEAGIKNKDINIMEVHDCFTIAEICAYEDLGFVKKGMGGKFIESGKTNIDGVLPTNTSGGLKAAGHPVGATGIKQVVEIVTQLSGKADKRQVRKNLKYGLTHNVGGSGATCVVSIFEKI